ncbi:FlgN protein [Fictibacillus solisalsi]|uniref:FlgN protein n=1 Tax=Fictibacillus solisalsi TaxID=459525 RepID=A0A1G9XZI3_9BACL|nr:flagellar export chaperone FlgN [Fictibacillus solisalsi]SDN02239.1 FlgN protein [Fictibacillus solisalsi]
MASAQMIPMLQKLLYVHKELNHLAAEKTDTLKKGDVAALDVLLEKENEYVKTLRNLEEQRTQTSTLTMSKLIEQAAPEEIQQLRHLQEQLKKEYLLLKQQNQLNQQLLHQSLQFVNMSMNMLIPEPEKLTYSSSKANGYTGASSIALFDSKA